MLDILNGEDCGKTSALCNHDFIINLLLTLTNRNRIYQLTSTSMMRNKRALKQTGTKNESVFTQCSAILIFLNN